MFKEYKNFEQLNSLVQLVLRLAINTISSWHQARQEQEEEEKEEKKDDGQKERLEEEEKDEEDSLGPSEKGEGTSVQSKSKTVDKKTQESEDGDEDSRKESGGKEEETKKEDGDDAEGEERTGKGDGDDDDEDAMKEDVVKEDRVVKEGKKEVRRAEDEDWTLEEKERLLHLVAKIFHMTFPLYSAHKQYYHGVTDVSIWSKPLWILVFDDINCSRTTPHWGQFPIQ